jgi:hypothetical protein
MKKIPKFVHEKIAEIASWHPTKSVSMTEEDLLRDYIKNYFEDPFVQGDQQFHNDQERHQFGIIIMERNYSRFKWKREG